MSDAVSTPDALPPPPRPRNPWKVATVVLVVLVAVIVVVVVKGGSSGDSRDNRNEKLAQLLPSSIETNYRNQGIDVSVSSVECDDLPTADGPFDIACRVRIDGLNEVIESTAQGTVTGDSIQVEDISSEERLLTLELAIPYVQGLVDELVDGVSVVDCDLEAKITVICPGSTFTCDLDSSERVTVTVGTAGSAEITDVTNIDGA